MSCFPSWENLSLNSYSSFPDLVDNQITSIIIYRSLQLESFTLDYHERTIQLLYLYQLYNVLNYWQLFQEHCWKHWQVQSFLSKNINFEPINFRILLNHMWSTSCIIFFIKKALLEPSTQRAPQLAYHELIWHT